MTVDRLGAARAAGGLCATARDVARLGLVVMRDGDGVLPEAFVEDLWEAGDAAAWAAGDYAHLLPGGAYRSLWYRARSGELLAIGIHGQLILVDRAREVVVVKQSSWPIAADDPADVAAIEWCQTIAERLASAG